jgi:hypothetical protein
MPHKVKDVIAALLSLDPEMDVWEYGNPIGECPLHRLPRVERVAFLMPSHAELPEDGYWHTLHWEPDGRDSQVQTVVMV